jgi:hypothetical protein
MVWRLGKRVRWPDYLARLWMGLWTLIVISILTASLTLAVGSVGVLCGVLSLPFRAEFQEVDSWIVEVLSRILSRVRQASWIGGVSIVVLCVLFVGCRLGGRLCRPGLRFWKSSVDSSQRQNVPIIAKLWRVKYRKLTRTWKWGVFRKLGKF